MRTRLLALAAAGLTVAAFGLSACGGDADEGSGGKVTLKFQSLAFQEPTIAATKKIIADWNADNPNIQVEYVQGSWDAVHDQLVTQFQGGTAPDIIHDESADIAGFAKQGYLADLTPYLDDKVKKSVSEGVWATVSEGEQTFAVPTLLQSYVVFGNQKLMQAGGVPPKSGGKWTWDDLAVASKKLTAEGKYGLGWGLKQPTATVMSLSLGFDGKFFEGTGADAKITVGANELEVPKRIHDMAYVDKSIDPTTLTQSGGDIMPGFYDGKYAMIVGGSFLGQQIKAEAPKGFEWVALPPLSGTVSDAQSANPQTLSVAAESKHVEEAAKFLTFFMQADNLAAVAQGDWLVPTSTDAQAAVLDQTKAADGWQQTIESGRRLTEAPFQTVDSYPQWKDQIATPALQQYLANKIDEATLTKQLVDGWGQVGGS